MTEPNISAAAHVDRCIEEYASRCRARIPDFVERHFALEPAWRTQQHTLWVDLLIAPVNALWAVPYLGLKRLCDGLDMVGVTAAKHLLSTIPSGVKTGFERSIEAAIARDVLEWDGVSGPTGLPAALVAALRRHPALRDTNLREWDAGRRLRYELQRFSAGRALVSSAAGTALTVAGGWFAYGTISMGLGQMANRIARSNARGRAASRFFLGRRAGSVFYSVFRPEASLIETLAILTVLALALAVGVTACTLASDPIRKALGLHQRRLHILVDVVERELTLWSKKLIAPHLEPHRPATSGTP